MFLMQYVIDIMKARFKFYIMLAATAVYFFQSDGSNFSEISKKAEATLNKVMAGEFAIPGLNTKELKKIFDYEMFIKEVKDNISPVTEGDSTKR